MPHTTPLPTVALGLLAFAAAVPSSPAQLRDFAPPTAPPIVNVGVPTKPASQQPQQLATVQYSIGNPTAEEQLYLEYINRARANPQAEADRLATTTDADVLRAYGQFSVNLVLMRAQFAVIGALPPLSMNSTLLTMGRDHSQNMFNLGYQGHGDSDGAPSSLQQRITNSGYIAGSNGENVFSYSYSTWYGHAGFEVDWGFGTGGMQVPPGHRDNIHSGSFREVGIGIVNGYNTVGGRPRVGPQLVTQEFGRRSTEPFITGVVYDDRNGNNFYDAGEGIPNVRVDVPNTDYYAVTGQSGGYSVPVIDDGNYPVTFSGGGISTTQRTATIANSQNAKTDLITSVVGTSNTILGNISTRARVGTGDNVLIGGFQVRGAGTKRVLIRGIGPWLGDFGVPNVLADPTLRVYRGSTEIAFNDNWGSSPDAQAIVASGKPPVKPLEAAVLLNLAEGDYTAIVAGTGANPSGAGMVEVYDLDSSATAKLTNISTRAVVGLGDDVMIGGLIVQGTGTQKVVIRAIGPSLTQYGVAGALQNPTMRIADANGTIASNDDWASGAGAAELTALGRAPQSPAESAVVLNLAPGSYTAVVSGVGTTTGVGLVEAYKID